MAGSLYKEHVVTVPIYDDHHKRLRATCIPESNDDSWTITICSRGGKKGGKNERNADYATGFALIVQRLAGIGAVLQDATLASSRVADLNHSQRQIRLSTGYPAALTRTTASAVSDELQRNQANVATERIKGPGNRTRKVRLEGLFSPKAVSSGVSFADYVTGIRAVGRIEDAELDDIAALLAPTAAFHPKDSTEARERILAEIARRRGQPKFRARLLSAYGGRCAVSGCRAVEVLEAAHIIPFTGESTHHVQNGLLLRADIHTLFDRGLLGIDPSNWRIVVHASLLSSEYGAHIGSVPNLPADEKDWPSAEALSLHLLASNLDSADYHG
jgi:putative restriction endonuclease